MIRLFLLGCLVLLAATEKCGNPFPAQGYSIENYLGKWYEMGKYQTAGGGYFQRDCVCTESDISRTSGTIYAAQSCIKYGKRTGVNATLLPTEENGKYIEQLSFNKANYYVIYLKDDYAIEYDCSQSLGIVNYCVHIMSRQLSIDSAKLEELKTFALGLGLNPRNLPFQVTEQHTCRNNLLRE